MVFKIYALYENHFELKNCLEYIDIAIPLIKQSKCLIIFVCLPALPKQSTQTLNDKHKYHFTIFQKGLKLLSVQIYTCSGFLLFNLIFHHVVITTRSCIAGEWYETFEMAYFIQIAM